MNKLCRKIIVELVPHNDIENYKEYSPIFNTNVEVDSESSLKSPLESPLKSPLELPLESPPRTSRLSPIIEEGTLSPATPETQTPQGTPEVGLTYSPATPQGTPQETQETPEDLSGDLEVISGGDTLNPTTIETKTIHL